MRRRRFRCCQLPPCACVLLVHARSLWQVAWLALGSISLTAASIPFRHAFALAVASLAFDAIFTMSVLIISYKLTDVAAIAMVSLLSFRAALVITAYADEGTMRFETASSMAVGAASTDAKALLQNLFPLTVVDLLKAGTPVPSQVHSGVAVLYADMAGFTKVRTGGRAVPLKSHTRPCQPLPVLVDASIGGAHPHLEHSVQPL